MGLKVHLVFPGIARGGFSTANRPGDRSLINHGLAMLGAVARDAGHGVSLSDLRACADWEEFRQRIVDLHPDVVGFTMLSCDFEPVMQAARIVKAVDPETITIVGGPHPSIMPEDIEPHQEIDIIFQGEGEVTFPLLLEQLEKGGSPPRLVQGIPPDLNALPFAARDLFGAPEIPETSLYFPLPFVTIIAGRGCRYNCSFCQPAERIMFGDRVRRRSVKNVIAELNQLRDTIGFRSLMIHDDCLTEDIEWVHEFCQRYRAESFNAPFICQGRADIVVKHPEVIEQMKSAGLSTLMIGFESGSDRVLRFLRKGTTVAINLEAAAICHRLGVRIWANYMLGLPTETEDEIRQTVEMIRTIRPDFCSAAYFTPHPGSDLFTYCRENDLSLIHDYGDYARDATSPKIKGIDPVFLEDMLERSLTGRRYHVFDRFSILARKLRLPRSVRQFAKRLIVRV